MRGRERAPHGTRARHRQGCRCLGCYRTGDKFTTGKWEFELRWPYFWLYRTFKEQLYLQFSQEQLDEWRQNGLSDEEADRVCIQLGKMPHEVFPSWFQAGMDYGEYP